MTNLATTLLDFILELLRNPAAAAEFNNDPQGALASAGLADVTPDDVHSVLPMLADCSPVRNWAAHEGSSLSGARWAPRSGEHSGPVHSAPGEKEDHHADHEGEGHEYAVIKHLQTIQNTFTITETHDSHDVWAHGDAAVLFGNDSTLLSNVDADHSFNDSLNDDHSTTVHGNGNVTGTGNHVTATNSGNTVGQMGDGSVLGNGNDVDNSTDSHDVSARDIQFGGNSIHATDSQNVGSTNVDGANNALGEHSQVVADSTLAGHDVNEDSTVAGHDVTQDSTVAGHDANSGEQITVGDVAVGDHYNVDAHTAVVDSDVQHSDLAGGGIDESRHLFSDNEVHDNHLLSDNVVDQHLPIH